MGRSNDVNTKEKIAAFGDICQQVKAVMQKMDSSHCAKIESIRNNISDFVRETSKT